MDTDYRFGFMTKFQLGLTERLRVGVRVVPWNHESTHLGDDFWSVGFGWVFGL